MTQTLRIDYFADVLSIFCMFCGSHIVSDDGVVKPCPHFLLIVTEDGYEYQSIQVKDILPAVNFGEGDDFETFIDRLNEVSGFPPNTFFLESQGSALMPGAIYMGFTPPI